MLKLSANTQKRTVSKNASSGTSEPPRRKHKSATREAGNVGHERLPELKVAIREAINYFCSPLASKSAKNLPNGRRGGDRLSLLKKKFIIKQPPTLRNSVFTSNI